MKRSPIKSRHRSTGPSPDVVEAVCERANYSCELCLVGVGPRRGEHHQIHHRRARRSGGSQLPDTNDVVNLLLLCPSCHEAVESKRTAAYQGGWLVHQDHDPAKVPVLIGATRWVLLTPDARYEPADLVLVKKEDRDGQSAV